MISPNHTPLEELEKQLDKLKKQHSSISYYVPSLWKPAGVKPEDGAAPLKVNPAEYFLGHIEAIKKHAIPGIDPFKSLNSQLPGSEGGKWISRQIVYNMFVRLTTAYDHNLDGKLGGSKKDITLNTDGIRESGTFLKSIALLGYIKTLGSTTIHLLPVTSIGKDGNKGELGSPYAIKNPYQIEESLADPLIEMSAEEQFQAFVEAAHLLGIRIITEFVFRTASKDSDWIAENPDWFYWIDERVKDRDPGNKDRKHLENNYGNPVFDQDELASISEKVNSQDFSQLPPPPETYKKFFTLPPDKEMIKINEKGQIRGKATSPYSGKQIRVRVPGAFADWPPDDNQPPWGDVTYLKMFRDENEEKPEFNYIAYNTIRMYDQRLARPALANESLWFTIEQLIPTYQRKYGIDGVMVDMGHAVPVSLMQRIVNLARSIDNNFAFLSENFEISEESLKAGYNAVVGYAWWVEYERDGMYNLLDHVGRRGVPLPFFGAVENHNTPRAAGRKGGVKYAKYAFLVNSFLPNSVPFVHSGQELGEVMPVNTGLDFSDKDLEKFKGKKLALFDLCGFAWDTKHEMLSFIQQTLELRKRFSELVERTNKDSFATALTGNEDVICYLRQDSKKHLAIVFNRDLDNKIFGELEVEFASSENVERVENLLAQSPEKLWFKVENQRIVYNLEPGECCLLEW
jgi:glycosidase